VERDDLTALSLCALIGFLLGHYFRLDQLSRRIPSSIPAVAIALVFPGASLGILVVLVRSIERLFPLGPQEGLTLSGLDVLLFLLVGGHGSALAQVAFSWRPLINLSKQRARQFLSLAGFVLLIASLGYGLLRSPASLLLPAGGLGFGFLIGLCFLRLNHDRPPSNLQDLFAPPWLVAAIVCALLSVITVGTILAPHSHAPPKFFFPVSGFCLGGLVGLTGLFFPRQRPLNFRDVYGFLRQAERYRASYAAVRDELRRCRTTITHALGHLTLTEQQQSELINVRNQVGQAAAFLATLPGFDIEPLTHGEIAVLLYAHTSEELREGLTLLEYQQWVAVHGGV
jgi:hypothetical protein